MSLIPGGRHRGKSPSTLRRDLATCERQMLSLIAALDQLTAERNTLERQLDEAGIALSGTRRDLRVARQETARVQAALTATRARLANATAVSDLQQHITTQPIPAMQRFETGRVIRLGASPLAGHDPSHVPPAA
ncbi:hypothetical protein [Streptomyces sp. NPDC101249]|uniref:hypothetical protein n=1 Tax=Streptomyces sp. NPDC101249 TaxID=3366140 RepID=UPI003823CF6A